MTSTVRTVRVHVPAVLWLLLSILSGLFGNRGIASAARYSNPLEPNHDPDPFVTFSEGYYYFLTSGDDLILDLRITRARTLEGLKSGQTKVVAPRNSTFMYGFPELHEINGTWWIYFTRYSAEWRTDTYNSLAVLQGGAAARDPFRYTAQLTNDTLNQEPTVLRVANRHYMVYACRTRQDPSDDEIAYSICIAPLLTPTSLGPSRVLTNASQPWELASARPGFGPQLGVPSAFYHKGKTFLSYDVEPTNGPGPHHPFGLLTYKGTGNPMSANNWVKSGPYLNIGLQPAANTTCYTAENKFFTSPDESEVWMTYNMRDYAEGCRDWRHNGAKRVEWNADDSPRFDTPGRLEYWTNGPSGED